MPWRSAFAASSTCASGRAASSDSAAQQLQPQRRVMQAAGGVDAGPEAEAHLPGGDGRVRLQPGHLLERADARAAAPRSAPASPWCTRMRLAPVSGTTSATVASATRSISALEVGLLARGEEAVVAQPLAQAHAEVEGHARGAQRLGGVLAAGLVRVEHRHRGRQRGRHRVVVHDHHVQAQLAARGRSPPRR